jgi:hypothetical protein
MPAVVALNVEAEGPHLQPRSGEMRRDAWIGEEWVINYIKLYKWFSLETRNF